MGPRGALQERRVLYSSSEPRFDQTEHALTELSTYENRVFLHAIPRVHLAAIRKRRRYTRASANISRHMAHSQGAVAKVAPKSSVLEPVADDSIKPPHRQSVEFGALLGAAYQQSQEAMEQSKLGLNAGTRAKYPSVLNALCELFPFQDVKTGGTRRMSKPETWWTQQKSAEFLPKAIPTLFDQATEHPRKFGANVCNPILVSLLGPDGQIPSGKQRDELLQRIKEKVFEQSSSYAEGTDDNPVPLDAGSDHEEEAAAPAQSSTLGLSAHAPLPGVPGVVLTTTNFLTTTFDGGGGGLYSAPQMAQSLEVKKPKSGKAKMKAPANWDEAFYKAVPKFWAWEHYGPFSQSCIAWFSLADGPMPDGPSRREQRDALLSERVQAAASKRKGLVDLLTTGSTPEDAHSPACMQSTHQSRRRDKDREDFREAEAKAHKRQKLDLALRSRKDKIEELKLLLSLTKDVNEIEKIQAQIIALLHEAPPTMVDMVSPPKGDAHKGGSPAS